MMITIIMNITIMMMGTFAWIMLRDEFRARVYLFIGPGKHRLDQQYFVKGVGGWGVFRGSFECWRRESHAGMRGCSVLGVARLRRGGRGVTGCTPGWWCRQARCTSPRQNQHFPNKRRSTNRTPSEVIPTPSPTGHQPAGRELRNPESP